jgi:hypothetical protein
MTFDELKKQEPRLVELEQSIRRFAGSIAPGESFCANGPWYRRFKPTLIDLVGFERTDLREDHVLRSPEAYTIALHHLYNLLPDCNHEERPCG